MQKKIVLLAVLIIIVIGAWLYLFFASPGKETGKETEVPEDVLQPPKMLPPERYEFDGIKYEIIGAVGPVYDIITGEITKEQAKKLAEKIIGDILIKEPDAQEITILFYGDFITAGAGKVDVAEITWTPEGINIKMMQ